MSVRPKTRSILSRILIYMIAVLVMQSLFFVCAVIFGGVMNKLETYAMKQMSERTEYRRNYIENEIVNKWMNLGVTYGEINGAVEEAVNLSVSEGLYASADAAFLAVKNNEKIINERIINSVTDHLLYTLNLNGISGIFTVFGANDETDKYGLYFHDNAPSNAAANYLDISIEVAPIRYDNKYNLITSSYLNTKFRFSSASDNWKYFFTKPIEARALYPELALDDYGWWSTPYKLNNESLDVLTYSLPLYTPSGTVYGVLGVEVSEDYLKTLMPFGELDAGNNGTYMLGKRIGGVYVPNVSVKSGFLSAELLDKENKRAFKYNDTDIKDLFVMKFFDKSVKDIYVSAKTLNIYDSTSPFYNETWELTSYIPKNVLFAESASLGKLFAIVLSASFLLGIVMVFLTAYLVSRPITALTYDVKNTENANVLKLDKTGIREIDDLTEAIENLSGRVKENQRQLAEILELTGMSVAVFEYSVDEPYLFVTDNFAEVIGLDDIKTYDYAGFCRLVDRLDAYMVNTSDLISTYHFTDINGNERWIEARFVRGLNEVKRFGVVLNVTDEYLEKQKLILERNYDSLTNIFNRRAFNDMLEKVFSGGDIGCAAFIMLDVDNLKYVNDTYGHDVGDQYIKVAADTIVESCKDWSHKIVGRRSGDEFYIFIYGCENYDQIQKRVSSVVGSFAGSYMKLPDDTTLKVRVSAGISLYPKDDTDYKTLIRYADFAMYEVKNTAKGEFRYFDSESYEQNYYLLRNSNELDKFLDNELAEYWFQPIVDVSLGEVHGYEALMRSRSEAFTSPSEILGVAKAHFKLNRIESLTFRKTLETFSKMRKAFGGKKMFINSVSNQILSDEEWKILKNKYGNLLKDVVVEFTEHEKSVKNITEKKLAVLISLGCETALDDYGTGYNGETALLENHPDYIKIDMSLVRNIDTDSDRSSIVSNIVSYLKEKNIKCIAEGVETKEELETLVLLGCDYVQGYLTGKPQPEPQDVSKEVKILLKDIFEKTHK